MQTIIRPSRSASVQQQANAFLILCTVIFMCCLIGILTRPVTFFAYLWPANAVLLGLFLRFNKLNNLAGWLGAFTGYMLADLITDNYFKTTFFLTVANLLTVSVSLFLIHYVKLNYRNYNKGFTFLYLFTICALGGCLASALFAISTLPYIPHTFMSNQHLWVDFGMWWTGEIVNCITILPMILFCPTQEQIQKNIKTLKLKKFHFTDFLPLIAIFSSVAFTHIFLGPGALLYPLAALIWAALSYPIFVVAIINSIVGLVTYHSLSSFYLSDSSSAYLSTTISVRIGLCMLGFAPLILCIITSNRQLLYQQMLYLANHDSLTNTINRRYFFEKGEEYLSNQKNKSVSLIMLDLDYFKNLNDRYGHYVGDLMLQHFSNVVKENIRTGDLFARFGGEEFMILILNSSIEKTQEMAERIRIAAESTPMQLEQQNLLFTTTSIGIAYQTLPTQANLQQLINDADHALYQSKSSGRNQVSIAS